MGKHSETKEKEIKKNKKKKKHIGRKILLLILIICVFAGVKFAKKVNELDGNWLAALLGHDEETLKNLDTLQILIMGESTGMSDTIIACSYNPKTQKASMLSIPRDTYVTNGNYKYSAQNKINYLYSGGETPEKTVEAVNEITGLDIKYYILVDTEALRKLVDLIGGVEFDVPINMNYDDYGQDLHIHLTKGYQKLNGDQAEQVVRFRHNNDGSSYPYEYGNEDYGRMKTQRNLIIAVAKQTIKLKNITEIKNMINIMKEDVKTNIDFNLLIDYIPYAINMNLDTIQTAQLPGNSDQKYGGWFFFHDEEETLKVVDELFNEKPEESTEGTNNVAE
ncbi:MAG: LCP family protein [Clostridia bacterium]